LQSAEGYQRDQFYDSMKRQRITSSERMNSGHNTIRSLGMNQHKSHRIAVLRVLNGNVCIVSAKT
jgi:hypothetical protein